MNVQRRPYRISDIPRLAKYANNWNISKYLSDQFPFPYTEKDAEKFIKRTLEQDPLHSFAIVVDDELVGGIGIHPKDDIHRKNAELGYWVAEPFWGKGIMSRMIREMVEYGFKTFDIERIYAATFGDNKASQAVLLKNGFQEEAHFIKTLYKDNTLHDEIIFGIRKDWMMDGEL